MKTDNILLQQWHNLFEAGNKVRSLHAQRHWQQLMSLGLPTSTDENWKYTSLQNLMSQKFVLPQEKEVFFSNIPEYTLLLDAIFLVFINGRFNIELSTHNTELFVIQTDTDYVSQKSSMIPAPIQPEAFLHLTESLAEEVTLIDLPEGQAARPLYLLHITSGQKDVLNTVHYRHHLSVGKHAIAKVIEHYVTLNSMPHFTGARFTFNVADNASLNHVKLMFEENDSYHFAHNDIIIGDNANVSSISFLLGSSLLRQNISVQLNGEHSELLLNSLVLPTHAEVADTRSYLEHNKGYCRSRQLHKTISRDGGRAVFNGHIKVAQNALKTDSNMRNNNLLLGYLSEADTKPQLEIYADDVKCSHGATVGCIDEQQIFYLRSRGIFEDKAKNIIIHAFASELIDVLQEDKLRQMVRKRITARFCGVDS